MFSSYLSSVEVNKQLIFLQGIYLKNPKHDPRWRSRYDILRDEDTQTEITIQISEKLTENLKDGNLVTVGGVLGKRVTNNSNIQLMLVVSRIEVVQEQTIDENEIKRMELRRNKAKKGFHNVDTIIEELLYVDQRPKIALIFAQSSITDADFNSSVDTAKSAIDFIEHRVSFSHTDELIALLNKVDSLGYTAIALIRGGGVGLEQLDELSVLECVVSLKTPIIAAIGHPEEKVFIKQLVDKEVAVPNDLGHFFKNIVEEVSEKKTRSRAVLTEQIKKQFKDQLEAGQKQNKELQEKLTKLTKTQEEATKKHNEQVEKAQKQNKDLQEQLKKMSELSEKQNKEFQENLKKLNEANTSLQKNLTTISAQNADTVKKLTFANEQVVKLQAQLAEAGNGGNTKIIIIVSVIIIIALIIALIAK
jgi:exonuclease VII large subunit